jgi:hypothetical protein
MVHSLTMYDPTKPLMLQNSYYSLYLLMFEACSLVS